MVIKEWKAIEKCTFVNSIFQWEKDQKEVLLQDGLRFKILEISKKQSMLGIYI